MEVEGGKSIDYRSVHCDVGDVLIYPLNNYATRDPEPGTVKQTGRLTPSTCAWMATMNGWSGAGFYWDRKGPLPFAFGRAAPERYLVGTFVKKTSQFGLRPIRRPPPRQLRPVRNR
jgi:hypothetical protein